MKMLLRPNENSGDGITIERSLDDGETWAQVAYVNAGAHSSTKALAGLFISAPDLLKALKGRFEEIGPDVAYESPLETTSEEEK